MVSFLIALAIVGIMSASGGSSGGSSKCAACGGRGMIKKSNGAWIVCPNC